MTALRLAYARLARASVPVELADRIGLGVALTALAATVVAHAFKLA